jgi:glycosyltransferase involved in cell wall biosynthesis
VADTPRVCVVAHAHPREKQGGGQAAAHRQFLALRAAGWAARFLAATDAPAPPAAAAPGEASYPVAGMAPDQLAWREASRREALLERLLAERAEVYHFHHYWRVGADLILALRRARPDARLVMTFHEMLAICLNHGQMVRTGGRELCAEATPARCLACFPGEREARLVIRKALLLEAFAALDAAIFPSEFLRTRYAAWGLRGPAAQVLENPLTPAMLAAPRAALATPGIEERFAFFGQATPYKGLDVLLPAFARVLAERPGAHLAVHGVTAAAVLAIFPALAPLLGALGRAVSFTGPYAAEEVLGFMRLAGWVVVPSTWWENSPMVIQEAKRAGTPLIVSDIGGMAEKVRPGLDGLHFRHASEADLARAMLEAAEPGRRAAMAATLADVAGMDAFLDGLRRAYASPA